ncbi:MAG TPA: ADOP family duplicated permease [Myxococcales bacterium]|jgi:predicted permease
MRGLLLDLRQSLRGFSRQPGFAAVAILALAIGVGSSTATFSLVDTVLRRPLPYASPERLLALRAIDGAGEYVPLGPAQFLHLQDRAKTIQAIGMLGGGSDIVTTSAGTKPLGVGHVSASLFTTLGVSPAIGRAFEPAEDYAGKDAVVVIADGFWRRELNGDPAVLGRTIRIDRRAVTIVGVLPPRVSFPLIERYELVMPLGITAQQLADRDRTGLYGIVRMKPGVTPDAVRAELDALLRAFNHNGIDATRFVPFLTGSYAPALEASFAAVLLLLVIACANVALLLLMRGSARARDLAIRAALGGGRARIARQHVLEGVLLAVAGGGLGLLLAALALRFLAAVGPLPRMDQLSVDFRMAAFAVISSLCAGALSGLASAAPVLEPDVFGLLNDGGASVTAGSGRSRLRDGMVVAQLAIALMLAAGTGLLVRSMQRFAAVPLGADPANLFGTFFYPERTASVATANRVLEAARKTPGVEEAALAGVLPFERGTRGWGESVDVVGRTHRPDVWDTVIPNWFSPGYLGLAGTRLLKGRDLAETDTATSTPVALVNQTFVDRYLAGRDPLGVAFDMTTWPIRFTIVGVVQDVHQWGPGEPVQPQVYLPQAQFAFSRDNYQQGFMLVTKSHLPVARLEPQLRAATAGFAGELLLGPTRALEDFLAGWSRQRRFYLEVALVFAAAALLLSALGVYGATAFSVVQRRRELAVRAALGARGRQLAWLVLGRGLRLALIGVAIGLAGSLLLSRFLAALLFGVGARDPLTFAAVAAALAMVTLAASVLPAAAAARQDPMTALRGD